MYPREVFDPLSYSLLSAVLLAGIGYFILLPPASLTVGLVHAQPAGQVPGGVRVGPTDGVETPSGTVSVYVERGAGGAEVFKRGGDLRTQVSGRHARTCRRAPRGRRARTPRRR